MFMILTEKEKFIAWRDKEISNGLLGIHVDWTPGAYLRPEEELYGAFNEAIAAPSIPDPYLF